MCTEAGPIQTDWAWSTTKHNKIYVHVVWAPPTPFKLPLKEKVSKAYFLAAPDKPLETRRDGDGITLEIPSAAPDQIGRNLAAVAHGELTIREGWEFSQMIDNFIRAIDTTEFARQLDRLEAAQERELHDARES